MIDIFDIYIIRHQFSVGYQATKRKIADENLPLLFQYLKNVLV
jgi:hypothetical protein